ncbi:MULTISPECIES: type I glyceraldehyde-3-phosphate dehydrogenase [Marinomonas]|uniref:Erythrose-4-phosphate dehydrogenase n=1 Tax=Marinomonas arctica TaxID=383750 RepID=A0A7H1J613_9GAMM|nr:MULTISPECIES: glyceraldehyde 3-phosphate dehydrogenase NAD-binding domain-containing protein [Marinomonas]MCS7484919.1 glyceraldehyde-3-phosphate dehydrogenase [Marinomonas sp. BSi20414]QNT05929.1 erythrose-4-phosphate dehydrogenase [Marinomonas arctica]GGN20149.1 D-erythrose-4-phosphate dehydrogenase [Marinomonas arctica]
MLRVAINGYGRIGRSVLRALYENGYRDHIQVVAINELSDIETISYLTRYDTTHGRFPLPVSTQANQLLVGDDAIACFSCATPDELDWSSLELDMVLECSGSFSGREGAQAYLNAGVPRLLLSQPAAADVDATIVYGFNHHEIQVDHRIVSAASCTTNCLIPVLDIVKQFCGVVHGMTQTIHSAMNDQPVIDGYHTKDLRLTRAALSSIIPVDTGLARGITRMMPELEGKMGCNAVRVPTLNVSVIDLVLRTEQDVTVEQIHSQLEQAANSKYAGLMGFTTEAHASVDFNHDPRSVIIDSTQTQVIDRRMVKLLCWFDNEWGYANRMLDVAKYWSGVIKR